MKNKTGYIKTNAEEAVEYKIWAQRKAEGKTKKEFKFDHRCARCNKKLASGQGIACKKCSNIKEISRGIPYWELDELSENGKKFLKNWWKPYTGDEVVCEKETVWHHYTTNFLTSCATCECCERELMRDKRGHFPVLTITQMIEFLMNSDDDMKTVSQLIRNYNYFNPGESDDNFCKQLWKAVKEILEE